MNEQNINLDNQGESNGQMQPPAHKQPKKHWFSEYGDAMWSGFQRAWHKRWLWIWGVMLPYASFNLNFDSDADKSPETLAAEEEAMSQWFQESWELALGIALAIVVLLLIFWMLSAIARGGTIRVLDDLQDGATEKRKFKEIWKMGRSKMRRIMGLDILVVLMAMLIVFVLMVPIIMLAIAGQESSAILLVVIAVVIFFVLAITIAFTAKIAEVLIVLGELKIGASLENGYRIFRKNIAEALKLLLFFLFMGILYGIAMGLGIVLITVVAALVFIPLGMGGFDGSFDIMRMVGSNPETPVIIALLIYGLIVFVFALLLKGIAAIWTQDLWVWWTKKVGKVEIVQEEVVEESVKDVEKKVITEPEGSA